MCLKFVLTGLSLLFCLLGAAAGIFLLRNPRKAIELQTRFYALINWRMTPISLQKEIRNTRIMGAVLFLVLLAALGRLLLRR